MTFLASFFVLVFSAAISWVLLFALIPILRRRLPDRPNARSSHREPTPRGGGFVFVSLTCLSSASCLISCQDSRAFYLPLLVLPLALVGLIDDRHNLPASLRYGFQLLTAVCILILSPLTHNTAFNVLSGSYLFAPVFCLLVIVVTALINFTNFMDGLDGLLAGCMALTITALAISLQANLQIWTLSGSLLGFLLWNWSPAKVFMGDVGSTFLGAVFAGLVLQASSCLEAFGYLLLATPLLADACICVLRRSLAGQRIFQAHRLHLYQRLHQAGWSHSRVSLAYISATALLAFAMLVGGLPWVLSVSVFELLIGVWLDQRVAVPFEVASVS